MKIILPLIITVFLCQIVQADEIKTKAEAQKMLNAFKTIQLKLEEVYKNIPESDPKLTRGKFSDEYIEANCLTIYTTKIFWQLMPEIHHLISSEYKHDLKSNYFKKNNCDARISESKKQLFLENIDY